MQIIINPDKSVWDKMCERNAPSDDKVIESVRSIVAEVRHSGDEALRRFAHDFDHADITDIELSAEERKQLYRALFNSSRFLSSFALTERNKG